MANACARNRPIALLVLSAEKRTCLQSQVCRRSCYDKKLNSKAMPTVPAAASEERSPAKINCPHDAFGLSDNCAAG